MTKRKPNSVRNYYYLELGQLQNDKSKCQRLGINLKNHEKIKQTPFDEKEEKEVVKSILRLCAKGSSVRKACLKLAGDDLGKMIRFQNKYRNVLKGNQAFYPHRPNNRFSKRALCFFSVLHGGLLTPFPALCGP